jgi:ABC-type transport system involved in multi-copper enzyme maturation permease subunit
MKTQMTPYRPQVEAGSDGFAQQLRAEWTKFRTVRAWVITLAASAVVIVLLAFLSSSGSHSGTCIGSSPSTATCTNGHPPVAIGPGGRPVADDYMYVHQPLVGDGTITARVASVVGGHTSGHAVAVSPNGQLHSQLQSGLAPWAKAGLLVEPNTRPGTAYAAVMVTGGHGVQMQYDYTHDASGLAGTATPSSPRWLRLSRAGEVITGYDSADGAHWKRIGSVRLTGLSQTVQVGLFVTSPVYFPPGANNGNPSVATANFDGVTTDGDFLRQSWTGEQIGAGGLYPDLPGVSTWQQQSAGAVTISGTGDIAPLVSGGIFGDNAGASILVGGIAGLLVLLVLATLFVTSEYRRGLIATTFAASPRRGRVIGAKAVVVGSVTFVAGAVGTAIALLISRHVLTVNGNYLFPVTGAVLARVIVGTGLLLALAAILVLALGTTLRRSAGAVVAGIVLLVLPFILGTTLPSGPANWLMRLTPTAAFAIQGLQPRSGLVSAAYTPVNGYYPLGPWAGLAVLCAYTAVALAGATWLLRRRDA